MQGMLEIFHETDKYMSEISGMDHFTFQPGGGSQGILTMASVMRAYFKDKGEDRDEIITTIYSHPSDAAAPAVAGFKIVYLQPDEKTGVPDLEPVSYTHLDVYKRQLIHRTVSQKKFCNPCICHGRHCRQPVSYTHLEQ